METLSRTPANLAGLDPNSSPTYRASEKPWFADIAVSWSAIVTDVSNAAVANEATAQAKKPCAVSRK